MTSDLEQIAEEMQDRGGQARAWAMRLRAWIAANKESPQREAFVEACTEWNRIREELSALPPEPWQAINAKSILLAQTETLMRERYRAMIEAEKVEAERGEET